MSDDQIVPMHWTRRNTDNPQGFGVTFDAKTPIGTYTAGQNRDGEFIWFMRGRSDIGRGKALSLELAKIGAQCDYIRRVSACLRRQNEQSTNQE